MKTLRYRIVPVTAFQQNCTVLWCAETGKAVVVDPGGEVDKILQVVAETGISPEQILLTHGHLDHVGGSVELAERLGLDIVGPQQADRVWLEALPQQSQMFGAPLVASFLPTRWLSAGDSVRFGQVQLQVYHCPGHTPGHLVFFEPASRLALVGDVLFAGSIGRTDFPMGNHQQLLRSIKEQLWPLGFDVAFIPGHGAMSTFGEERRNNPFVAD